MALSNLAGDARKFYEAAWAKIFGKPIAEAAPPPPGDVPQAPAGDNPAQPPTDTPGDGPTPAPAKMKNVGGVDYPSTDFLSVPDVNNPDTWSLQVKKSGEYDPALLAAAHVALTGDGYTGADKAELLSVLEKLYAEAGVEWPGSTQTEARKWAKNRATSRLLTEMYLGDASGLIMPTVPYGAKTFADIEKSDSAHEAVENVNLLTQQLCELVCAALEDTSAPDKTALIGELVKQYQERVTPSLQALSTGAPPPEEPPAAEAQPAPVIAPAEVELRESASCVFSARADSPSANIGEAAGGEGRRGPIDLEVEIIQPGPGNSTDKNYYPAAMLKREAQKLVGVPMYSTDHKADEKSERNKTAVVKEVLGFSPSGAPRALVTIIDPDLAEKTRNRRDSGTLGTLKCSIYASGKAKPGKVDGKEYNIVEEISAFHSVDWVSEAGAGGVAVRTLTESGSASPAPVAILSDEAVRVQLGKHTELAESVKTLVFQAKTYATIAEVEAEVERLKDVIREQAGGRVKAFEQPKEDNGPKRISEAELTARLNRVNAKFLK